MADRAKFQRRWEERGARRRGKTAAAEAKDSYYGVPVIHGAHWGWVVILYFFFGGISAASYVIATVARLAGGAELAPVARTGRYLSFAALLPCPVLLILDLGRPERFLNMLRVFKFRSVMSMGSWGLSGFGLFATLSVMIQAARDGFLGRNRVARSVAGLPDAPIGAAGIFPAFFVGGYTGVLLGATAVPLWAKCAKLIGPLFLNSAFSSATSAITIATVNRRDNSEAAMLRLERLEQIALIAELGLMTAIDRTLGDTAAPMRHGRTGTVATAGALGMGVIAPLALVTVNRRLKSRKLATAGSLLAIGGGLCLRYAAVKGGHLSADDPHATFAMTRKPRD